jgi:hypothetical protein
MIIQRIVPNLSAGDIAKARRSTVISLDLRLLWTLQRAVSRRRQCVSEQLPRQRSLAAQATEVPSPPDPHLVVSVEQCAHPEIRARHGASTVRPYSLVGRWPSRKAVFPPFQPTTKRDSVIVTALENASSVPGRTQTATARSSAAAKPRVPVPKSRVVSLSPTWLAEI